MKIFEDTMNNEHTIRRYCNAYRTSESTVNSINTAFICYLFMVIPLFVVTYLLQRK